MPVDEEASVQTDPRLALDAWLRSVDDLLAEDARVPDQPQLFFEEEPEQPVLIGKLWGKLRKERDLELHVRTGWIFGAEYLQLVDYVPSTGRYETSVLVERRLLGRLVTKLAALHRYSCGTAATLR